MASAKGSPPWQPPSYTDRDIAAIQALARGDASPDQQTHALRFIVETICCCYDMSFRPGVEGDRDTAFAEGRRFVGLQLVKMTKLNVAALRKVHG